MRKILDGIRKLLVGQKQIVIEKEAIQNILPHRGDKLLLDKVTIDEHKITGEFLVTEAVCAGHVIAGIPVMKGSDFCDMAAQLLGVLVSQLPETISILDNGKKTLAALRYDGVLFKAGIHPGEKVSIETTIDVEFDERHGFTEITGGRFNVRVGNLPRPRVSISSVTLTPVNTENMKPK